MAAIRGYAPRTSLRQRVRQYLEEMFVRQLETEHSEADDLIAYYCQVSLDETKTIFSSDRDLTQLISEKVSIYSPSTKQLHFDPTMPNANVMNDRFRKNDGPSKDDYIKYGWLFGTRR